MPDLISGGSYITEYEMTRSWGIEPGSASGKGVGMSPLAAGDEVAYSIFGVTFYGIVACAEVVNSFENGVEFSFQLVDDRIRLKWAVVFGQWNMERDPLLGGDLAGSGSGLRLYRRLPPELWESQMPVYDSAPVSAATILDEAFGGALGGANFGLHNHSHQSKPVFNVDCNSGTTLAALVQQLCDAQGLQVTLSGQRTLKFDTRGGSAFVSGGAGGYVSMLGSALSAEPTRVRVVGGRTLLQVNGISLEPDWSSGWEAFISEPAWLDAVEATVGSEGGQAELAARAREITLAEYCAAAGGDDLVDHGRWGSASRMSMPVWSYLNSIVYRSYRIPSGAQLGGVPMRSLEIHDQLLCEVIHNGSGGVAYGEEYYPQAQAHAIANGQGIDGLDASCGALLRHPSAGSSAIWSEVGGFSLDAVNHSIRFPTAVFLDGDTEGGTALLLYPNAEVGAEGDDYRDIVVPNPDYAINPAAVKVSLVFRMGVFFRDFGSGERWTVRQVPAIARHLLAGEDGGMENATEIPYEDGSTAETLAADQAAGIIVRSGVETSGQYIRYGVAGTALSGAIDRVTVTYNFLDGLKEVVDFSHPRPMRGGLASSKEIAERVKNDELYDNQRDLAREVSQLRMLARLERHAAMSEKARGGSHTAITDVFRKPLGAADTDVHTLSDVNSQAPTRGGGWKAGDIVWLDTAGRPSRAGKVFGGVVVMSTTSKNLAVVTAGTVPVAVTPGTPSGPVSADPGQWYAGETGSYPIGMLAHAGPVPGTGDATLALVRLGGGGASEPTDCPFGEIVVETVDGESRTAIAGGVVFCGDKNYDCQPMVLDLEADGTWLVQMAVECESNRDDLGEIFLPGIRTGTAGTVTMSAKAWETGTQYDSNTNPIIASAIGTIVIPLGKLVIAEGVATFAKVGCGHIEIGQCAGILNHTRL